MGVDWGDVFTRYMPGGELVEGILESGPAKSVTSKENDLLVKDTKVKLSQLLQGTCFASQLDVAMGVVWAESRADNHAKNYCCTCLFQVHKVHAAGAGLSEAEFVKKLEDDPQYCVEQACRVYAEQGWGAWETYTNGSYRKYLGKDADITLSKGTLTGTVGDVASTVTDPFKDFFSFILSPDTWFRIAKTGFGAFILAVGVGFLIVAGVGKATSNPTVRKAAKVAITKKAS